MFSSSLIFLILVIALLGSLAKAYNLPLSPVRPRGLFNVTHDDFAKIVTPILTFGGTVQFYRAVSKKPLNIAGYEVPVSLSYGLGTLAYALAALGMSLTCNSTCASAT